LSLFVSTAVGTLPLCVCCLSCCCWFKWRCRGACRCKTASLRQQATRRRRPRQTDGQTDGRTVRPVVQWWAGRPQLTIGPWLLQSTAAVADLPGVPLLAADRLSGRPIRSQPSS